MLQKGPEREKERRKNPPHEVNAQVDAELDEELVHLAEIGGVAVRVEEGRGGHWVVNVERHYLRAALRRKLQDFHVLAVRERREEEQTCEVVRHHLVRRRARRQEGELCRHG